MSSATDEITALRIKIVQLELKHRINRMAQNTERMMQAAMEKKDLEQKMEKKDQEQKMELTKMQAALEKQALEQKMKNKMELMKIKMQAALEKKDLEQKMEKKDLEQKMEFEKRDRLLENEKRDRLLENEKRERETDKKETQLKWEARVGRLEQQLHTMQPLNNPVQNFARLNLAQQTANEELMLERLQLRQLERQEKETGSSHPIASTTAVQVATLHSTAASALLPSAVGSSAPTGSTNVLITSPLSTRPVEAGVLQQEQHQSAAVPSASNAPSRIVQQQPRQQVATGPEPARTAAVALPSDARMHFFLSHCQGTGGDQTNAIYLELRQLGFACWYSALFFDLLLLTHIFLPS
jgi:hypothetical protein